MNDLRILVADDHEIVRQGLVSLLSEQSGWTVVNQASNGVEAVRLARESRPAVVVMDMTMPEMNGLDAARQIHTQLPNTEILILTAYESSELVREAVAAGARGVVLKNDAGNTLVQAIASLAEGKLYFSSKLVPLSQYEAFDQSVANDAAESEEPRLTPREREVVRLIAEGSSNKEIGTALGISVRTVETHRMNIMRKFGMQSVSELVRYAIRNRIIEA